MYVYMVWKNSHDRGRKPHLMGVSLPKNHMHDAPLDPTVSKTDLEMHRRQPRHAEKRSG